MSDFEVNHTNYRYIIIFIVCVQFAITHSRKPSLIRFYSEDWGWEMGCGFSLIQMNARIALHDYSRYFQETSPVGYT